ncbi:MAG TPA: BON domain-containing protein [Roseiflexaceae bacterium]|nr:BON domain-containing protein [Roseiflexaceae bacterium]
MAVSNRRPSDAPLNPPDPDLERKVRQLAGDRAPEDQGTPFNLDEVGDLGQLTRTDVDEGNLIAEDDDRPEDTETIEMLTELELRDGETDDPMEAVEEGYTYVPPIDPPTVPGGEDNAEIASGLGVSALDEPFDADHHDTFMSDDDEVSARVREALRADSSTTQYAYRVAIATREGVVTLRGIVDDLTDSDNLLAVAGYVDGVEDVMDELRVRGLE